MGRGVQSRAEALGGVAGVGGGQQTLEGGGRPAEGWGRAMILGLGCVGPRRKLY